MISIGNRRALDPIIDGLVKRLRYIECRPGDLNYTVTRTVLESLRPHEGWSYHSLSDAVRVLRDAADEIHRRLLGPYADDAIRKNGDMRCFVDEPFSHLPPLDVCFEDLPPVTEALTDEQIAAVEKERNDNAT